MKKMGVLSFCFIVLTLFLTNLQIRQFSGAVVSTKGLFMAEIDKGKAGYVKP